MSSIALHAKNLKSKSIMAALAIAAALALPQVFHAVGMISGTDNLLGSAFLPMHLPVLLAGLLGGPLVGVVAGAASPVLSFVVSGMPAAAVLPFMALELAVYGLAGGLLRKTRLPVFVKLFIAQLAGRAARAAAVVVAVYLLGSETVQLSSIWTMVTTGLPGILLQWALIPLALYRMEGLKKFNE